MQRDTKRCRSNLRPIIIITGPTWKRYWYTEKMRQRRISQTLFHLDTGGMLAADRTVAATNDKRRFSCWDGRSKQSKGIKLVGRLHSDLCNVRQIFLPGVQMQIKLTKAKKSFYILAKAKDSKATFKFLDAQLFVNRVRPSPAILLAHANALRTGCIGRYHLTRVELPRPSRFRAVRNPFL